MGVVTRCARTAPLWLLSLGLLAPGCFDPLPPDDAAATPRDVAAEAVDTPEPIDLPTFDIPPLDRPATDVAPDRGPADVAPEAARPDTGMDTGTDTGADTGTDTGAALDASAMMPDADAGDVPVDLPDAGFDIPTVDVPIVTRTELLGPSRGSAVAVTADDRIVVSANRVSGSASVFAMVPGSFGVLARINELALGAGSEPVSVVMAPDNNAAYVLLRVSQRVVRIDRLRSGGELFATRAVVGSEPTSMALSPSGRTLYVTNWGDGTVTVVDTESMRAAVDLELNEALARGGFLGAGAVARRGLAHPRAVVITNDRDGDDDDEVAWVTEYFAQGRTTPGPTGNERFDQSHVGVVYRIPLFTREASAHTLEPAASMGFRDASNVTAGCYPNQLSAIALAAGRVYVAGTCTSPRGPIGDGVVPAPGDAGVPTDAGPTDAGPRDGGATDAGPPAVPALPVQRQNLRTLHTPALWVLDGMTGSEIAAQRVLLNSRWLSLYDARRTPDTDARRYPLTPVDLAFVPGTDGNTTASTVAWVLAYGADAMFRVRFNTNGTVAEVGATGAAFVDLDTAPAAGRGPYGMALGGAASNNAVVVHEHTRNVSLVRLDTQTVIAGAAVTDTALSTANTQIADGRWAFHTGRGRWSLNGQAWSACGSCHPDGLSDNVTWYTARGPRQTIPLDSALNAAGLPRIFGWTAQADEVSDMETEARSTQGGVGAVVHRLHNGLMPPQVSAADRIVFDGTAAVSPQRATPDRHNGLSGTMDGIANATGTLTPRSVLNDWAAITAYVRSIRTPRPPTGLVATDVTAGQGHFVTGRCAGCHGGDRFTLSRRFYTPGAAVTHPSTGTLVTRSWMRQDGFPTAVLPLASAPFRTGALDPVNDQITCVLRNVGTWAAGAGVTAQGVTLAEVRTNMTTASQGANGFNIPSLWGVAHSAPYFHGGNARTLEEALGPTFDAHARAFNGTFLAGTNRATVVRQLVAYLLTLDPRAAVVPVPDTVPGTPAFDPDPCDQF